MFTLGTFPMDGWGVCEVRNSPALTKTSSNGGVSVNVGVRVWYRSVGQRWLQPPSTHIPKLGQGFTRLHVALLSGNGFGQHITFHPMKFWPANGSERHVTCRSNSSLTFARWALFHPHLTCECKVSWSIWQTTIGQPRPAIDTPPLDMPLVLWFQTFRTANALDCYSCGLTLKVGR